MFRLMSYIIYGDRSSGAFSTEAALAEAGAEYEFRRVSLRDVRAVWIPGVFFGLNLAVFFAGATHNSVANAALIGSCAPFLIVPAGAWLFREYLSPRALLFAVLAFGGVALVLLSAPPGGDASLEGNVFGVLAMLLLVSYVAPTPQKYYVVISTTDPFQTYDVTFLLSRGTPCDDDSHEPNDLSTQATALNTATQLDGAICPQDQDWFSASVPS
jgi:hypothetical protein